MSDDFKRHAWNSTLKARAHLKRTKGLDRGKPLERNTPLRSVNPERRRKRFARAYESTARVRWTQRLPCICCRKCPTEVAHVRSRAAGGTAAETVPLCLFHHRQQHDMGIESFQAFYNIDLAAEAHAVDEAWRERQG